MDNIKLKALESNLTLTEAECAKQILPLLEGLTVSEVYSVLEYMKLKAASVGKITL